MIVPILWAKETASVDPETRRIIVNELQLVQRVAFVAGENMLNPLLTKYSSLFGELDKL